MKSTLALSFTVALTVSCGPNGPASLIDGEWKYAFTGSVQCANGTIPSGTLVVYEGVNGALTGEYDICAKTASNADLTGRIRGARFELFLFGGSINVVNGSAVGDALSGDVVGIGEGVRFVAVRAGARVGKISVDPPPDPTLVVRQ